MSEVVDARARLLLMRHDADVRASQQNVAGVGRKGLQVRACSWWRRERQCAEWVCVDKGGFQVSSYWPHKAATHAPWHGRVSGGAGRCWGKGKSVWRVPLGSCCEGLLSLPRRYGILCDSLFTEESRSWVPELSLVLCKAVISQSANSLISALTGRCGGRAAAGRGGRQGAGADHCSGGVAAPGGSG